jgi:hypothetical protein
MILHVFESSVKSYSLIKVCCIIQRSLTTFGYSIADICLNEAKFGCIVAQIYIGRKFSTSMFLGSEMFCLDADVSL